MKYLLIIFLVFSCLLSHLKSKFWNIYRKNFPNIKKSKYNCIKIFHLMIKLKLIIHETSIWARALFSFLLLRQKEKTSASVVSIKVQLFKKLLVANKDYEKELLNISGFEEKVLDVTRLNGNPVSVDFAVLNYRAKTFIKKVKSFSKKNWKDSFNKFRW